MAETREKRERMHWLFPFIKVHNSAALLHCIYNCTSGSPVKSDCFVFHRGSKHLETIKALSLQSRAFIRFSVFETSDKTLGLVFHIILKRTELRIPVYCSRLEVNTRLSKLFGLSAVTKDFSSSKLLKVCKEC